MHSTPKHRGPVHAGAVDAANRARCTCLRDALCPRHVPITYSQERARHRKSGAPPPADVFRYHTTTPWWVTR